MNSLSVKMRRIFLIANSLLASVFLIVFFLLWRDCFAKGAEINSSIERNDTASLQVILDGISGLEKRFDELKIQENTSLSAVKSDLVNANLKIDLFEKDLDFLKTLEEERKHNLDQREKMLDIFIKVISLFMSLLSFGFVILAFMGFKNINEIKKDAEKAKEKYLSQSQKIIKEVMASSCEKTIAELEKKIYRLECFNDMLKIFLAKQQQSPVVPEEGSDDSGTEGESGNAFDQP